MSVCVCVCGGMGVGEREGYRERAKGEIMREGGRGGEGEEERNRQTREGWRE
jgi:hypothetical protein